MDLKGRYLVLVLPLILGGAQCMYSPPADVINALAGDQNSLCWSITTPWGGSSLDRNHGCSGNAASPAIPLAIQPAPVTLQLVPATGGSGGTVINSPPKPKGVTP